MAFEYQGFATLGVNLNRQKYGPLDISAVFTSAADFNYYISKGTQTEGVSEYWKAVIPYPYAGQVLATVIDGVVNVFALKEKDDGTFETQEIGGKVEVDGKTIKINDAGALELVGLDEVETGKTYVPSLVNGTLTWSEPDTTTVEGLTAAIDGLGKRTTALEESTAAAAAAAVVNIVLTDDYELVLQNTAGEQIGSAVDASDFVKDSFLDDVDYDADTHVISFTWKMADGSTKTDSIDVTDLVDTYSAGEGLLLENATFKIDPDIVATKIDIETLKTETNSAITDAISKIPAATAEALGLVKASTEVTVAEDGTLGLGEVSTDKLVQGKNTLILNGNG